MDSHDPAPEMASWDAFRTATNDAVRERTGKSNFRMTDEQEFIVQEFQRGKNLRIKALAGCSKTTTCMLCALASQHRRDPREFHLITYSKDLQLESERAAKQLGLGDRFHAHTIHGFLGMLFGGGAAGAAEDARVFKDDHSILELVDGTPHFETHMDRTRARQIGTLAFDESQDLYLTIYRAIRPFLEATVDTTQIIVVGDSNQLLRNWQSLGTDGMADNKYLDDGRYWFRSFVDASLTKCFRFGPKVAQFLNEFMQWPRDAPIRGMNPDASPVEYNFFSQPDSVPAQRYVQKKIEEHGIQGVLVTGDTVKARTPPNRMADRLNSIETRAGKLCFPVYMRDAGTVASAETLHGKLLFLSSVASKGQERACTVNYGATTAYRPDKTWAEVENKHGVALSRGTQLCIIHTNMRGKDGKFTPAPLRRGLDVNVLRRLVAEGVVVVRKDGDVCRDPMAVLDSIMSLDNLPDPPTARFPRGVRELFGHMGGGIVRDLAQLLTRVETTRGAGSLEKYHNVVARSTAAGAVIHEDTSALYGTLVTVMLEHAFTGGHSTTLDRLRSAVVVHYRTTYTRALLEQAGFDAESIDTLGPDVDMRGISGIALERFARSQGRLVVPSQHESRFRECLALLADREENKSPAVFMYFTALQQALESSVFFRWRQIGRDLSAYASFVEDAPLQVAVARGLELIQSLSRRGTPATSVRFEVPVVLSVDDTIVRRIHDDHLKDASQVADRIFGAVDVVIGDDDPLFVEIKFTSALEADHVLQLGMYLSMQALNTDRVAKGLLVNLRTGEQRTMEVAPGDAHAFIAHTLAAPLEPRPRRGGPQEPLEAEDAEEVMDASVRKKKRVAY